MRLGGLIQLVETVCGYNEYIATVTPKHRQEKMHEDKLLLQEKMGNAVNFSKSIAEASKHDASAMKTIAVLTMVFLPGTFVAVSSL